MEETSNSSTGKNKRHFSASGSILLPLALKWRLLSFLVAVFITAFVMPCATADKTLATSDVKLELTVPKALSFSVSPDGQLHSQQSDEIEITSDAYAGYTFTLRGSDDTKQLKNGTTAALNSITAAIDATTYGGTGYLNTWGYLPSKLDGTANTKYQPGPTTEPVTIEKTTSSNSTANKYTITLGAKVDSTLPTGNYGNTFILTVTANDVPYTITYDLNSGIGGPSTPQESTGAVGSTVTIGAAPTRQGYEFKGWCDKQTTNEICSGNIYQPDGTYTLTNSANNVTLYAMWEGAQPTTMDTFNSAYCTNNMTTGQTITLTDSRGGIDSNGTFVKPISYRIRKLADGKCWMIDNLRLGNTSAMSLTTSDSDVSSSFSLPASSTSGFSSNTAANVYVDKTYGGYYTWCAATAGTCSSATSSGQVASSSICPKGWRLPTGGSSGEFQDLYDKLGTPSSGDKDANLTDVNGPAFVRAGNYDSGSPNYQGSYGYYWSSTALSSTYAYSLYFYSSDVTPASYDLRCLGFSVRCVAK